MASKLEKRATILILTGLDTFKPQEVLSTDWQSIKMVKKKKEQSEILFTMIAKCIKCSVIN